MNAYKPQSYKGRAYSLPEAVGAAPVPGNDFSKVSLLLHFDNVGSPTTFIDSSPVGHASISANGNATQSALVTEYGGGALKLDGAGDWLTVPDHASLELGSSDFQISADIYLTAWATSNAGVYFSFVCAKDGNAATNRSYIFYLQGTASSFTSLNFVGFQTDGVYTLITTTYSFVLNTWYHLKAIRKGNRIYLCVNDEVVATGAFTYTIQNSTRNLSIGSYQYDATNVGYLAGYIEEFRIVKGDAYISELITRPAAAYPNS